MSGTRTDTLADIIKGTATEDFAGNKTWRVSVAESNKSPTNILLSNDEVTSGDPAGTVVGILTVVDENINDTHTWEIIEDTDDKFTIVENDNVQLVLKNSVNFSTASSHDVIIRVTDSTNLTFEKLFTITVLPVYDNSYSLNLLGVSEYISGGDIFDIERTDARSWSFWFKTTDAAGAVMSRRVGTGSFKGWEINNTSGQIGLNMSSNNVTGNRLIVRTTISTYNDGDWHHCCITYGGTSTAASVLIYIDGSSVALTTSVDNLTADITNTANFNIGSRNDGENLWTGNIDEPNIWDRELTAPEVTELYNSGSPDNIYGHSAIANCLAWWRNGDDPLDDATGGSGNIQDQIGTSHLTPVNTLASAFVLDVP